MASGLLDSGFSCILQMPTGSGKTWLAEQAIARVLDRGLRAIYLTPLRALATELLGRWEKRFAPHTVGIFTGDYGTSGNPYPVPFRDARLLVMTPERLDACTRSWRAHWGWIPDVDLIVVDEFHLLGDQNRGARLEGALSRLRRLNPFVRVLGLSATLGNRCQLADWLEGVEYQSTQRPVPIRWRVVRYKKAEEKPTLLLEEVSRNLLTGGKSLVFVQSRRRAETLSRCLSEAGVRAVHHHAGLTHEQRRLVEEGFRGQGADVLVATATLEMGLNLPVRQVILYDLQQFDGIGYQPLSVNSVWQRVGRAGRPGLDSEGEAVLLAPVWDRYADRYETAPFEPIRSGLADPRAVAEQVVVEVSSGLGRTRNQINEILQRSLAAHQGILPDVPGVISEMLEAGMLKEIEDEESPRRTLHLKATRLGRVAVRHLLAPATILLFQRVLANQDDMTFLDLLLLAASTEDCEPVLPADFEELDELSEALARERSLVLQTPREQVVKLLGVSGKRLLSAIKMALVARAWTRTGDAEAVAKQYNCYPFEVDRLCESLERLLLAQAAVVEKPGEDEEMDAPLDAPVPIRERIKALQRMVAAGLDEEVVTLTLIKGLGPAKAKQLTQVGIGDIEALALAAPAEVAALRSISAQRAARWIEEAQELIKTRSAFWYRETGPTVSLTPPGWPTEVDPYRLRRSQELKVVGPDGGLYRVTGGSEPHIVRSQGQAYECDCPDAAKGNLCKHVLAVRRHRGDRSLRHLEQQLAAQVYDTRINLFDLWYDQRSNPVTKGRISYDKVP